MQTYILLTTKEIVSKSDLLINTLQSYQNIILYKVSNNILNNIIHKGNSIILSNNDLSKFNVFNYKLNKEQIVIPILNILYPNLILYLEQFNDSSHESLKNIYNILLLNSYFKENNSNYLNYLINNLDNIKLEYFKNIDLKFNNRRFRHFTISNDSSNYLNDISNFKKSFIDISCDYDITNHSINDSTIELTNQDIYNMFLVLDDKQKFLLYCNLLISEKYCNNVINNYNLLKMMRETIIMFGPLFRYLLSYTWINLYKDECIKSKNKNYIFELDTAELLPMFPFNYLNPKFNPYMPLLINNSYLSSYNNFIGYVNNNDIVMLCSQDKFQTKFNIFCTNIEQGDKNLFENFDFKKNNCYIIGSSLLACIQLNPMGYNILNKNFKNYLDEFYQKSDIDIMFLEKDLLLFIDKVSILLEQLDINIQNIYNVNTSNINKKIKKILCLIVNKKFIEDNISENYDFIIKNIYSSDVIEMFKSYHDKLFKKEMDKYEKIDNNKYADLFDNNNIIYRIKINSNNDSSNIQLKISLKYDITSKYLQHPLEIFSNENENVIDIVSNFHLPCVRLFYNGITYLLPSCISAICTSMCLDYKYFSSTKNPMKILSEKKFIGFGTWINNYEKKQLTNYIINDLYWKTLIPNINTKNIQNIIFTPISNFSKLMKPRFFTMHLNKNLDLLKNRYINSNINDVIISSSISEEIYKKFNSVNISGIDYDLFQCIDTLGNILPIKKWIIETTWNLYADFSLNIN